jgi:hypothetical protein
VVPALFWVVRLHDALGVLTAAAALAPQRSRLVIGSLAGVWSGCGAGGEGGW